MENTRHVSLFDVFTWRHSALNVNSSKLHKAVLLRRSACARTFIGTNASFDDATVGTDAVEIIQSTCAGGFFYSLRSHNRRRFGLPPRASAMADTETPGCIQAATASALNSSLCCLWRRRPSFLSSDIACMCPLLRSQKFGEHTTPQNPYECWVFYLDVLRKP